MMRKRRERGHGEETHGGGCHPSCRRTKRKVGACYAWSRHSLMSGSEQHWKRIWRIRQTSHRVTAVLPCRGVGAACPCRCSARTVQMAMPTAGDGGRLGALVVGDLWTSHFSEIESPGNGRSQSRCLLRARETHWTQLMIRRRGLHTQLHFGVSVQVSLSAR